MEERRQNWHASPDDKLTCLLRQSGLRQKDLLEHSARMGKPVELGRSFFSNTRRVAALPAKRGLSQLGDFFSLTADGTYRIYDVVLDDLAVAERLLNVSRTRIVETYVFDRDAPLPFPKSLNPRASPEHSAFLKDIVEEWQPTTARSFESVCRCPKHSFYLQLGQDDDSASPAVPRGAVIQVAPVDAQEALRPRQHSYYVIQHGHGYLCSRCSVEAPFLILRPQGSFYAGHSRLRLATQAQIMGKSIACIALLPSPRRGNSSSSDSGPPAPIMVPGQHLTIREKFVAARLRYAMPNREIDEAVERMRPILGYGVTGKHVKLLEEGRSEPHTSTCLVLTPIYSLRYQDVLRVGNVVLNDVGRWSLDTKLHAKDWSGPFTNFIPAVRPSPSPLWSAFFGGWHDLPTLLHQMRTRLAGRTYEFFYLNQSQRYRGLDPLLPSGSILAIEPIRHPLRELRHNHGEGWERPIYLLRVRDDWVCSYIDDGDTLTLIPHSAAKDVLPRPLRRTEAEIYGVVIGAMFPLPNE
jgi:hypothetical protein